MYFMNVIIMHLHYKHNIVNNIKNTTLSEQIANKNYSYLPSCWFIHYYSTFDYSTSVAYYQAYYPTCYHIIFIIPNEKSK